MPILGFVRLPALAALSLVLAGCGSGLVPVKGTVRIDGKPAAHAFVLFTPQEADGKEAHGSSDASGAFELRTERLGKGALPGLYKVTVAYSEPAASTPAGKTPAETQQAATEQPPARMLPAMYTQLDQTILKHRVPDDGDVKLELQTVAP